MTFNDLFEAIESAVERCVRWRDRVTARPAVGCPLGCLLMLVFLLPFVPAGFVAEGHADWWLAVLILPCGLVALLGLWVAGETVDRMGGGGIPRLQAAEAESEEEWREFVESQEAERSTGPLPPLPHPDALELGEFVFHAAGFNASKEDPDWINPGLFGEDLADWFEGRFVERGLEIGLRCDEDWGWSVDVVREGVTYTLGVSGIPELREGLPDIARWDVHLHRRRGLVDRLLFRGRLEPDDPVLALVAELVDELRYTES